MRLIFLPLILLAVFLVAACQSAAPGIEVRTVQVPTPVPCLPASQIAAEPPLVADDLTGVAARDLLIVGGSALDLRAWGRELHAALVACAAD